MTNPCDWLIVENPSLAITAIALGSLVVCPAHHDKFWFRLALWGVVTSILGMYQW
jgi:hypothetical protein